MAETDAVEQDEDERMGDVHFDSDSAPCLTPGQIDDREQALRVRFAEASGAVLKHLARLQAIFETAASNGLSFKLHKSQLLRKSLRPLGTITGENIMAPDPAKIQGIQDFPPPVTKTQLREFFGSVNWLRPFHPPSYAQHSADLRRYPKKE